jgi:hypothetical protein
MTIFLFIAFLIVFVLFLNKQNNKFIQKELFFLNQEEQKNNSNISVSKWPNFKKCSKKRKGNG